ncbi:zinc metalloprotease HtpX [Streptacidiphilus anmyonensis]|uniref:zinc metalloprotease HtpX n=1 Tax=Streptacidiphilus anmyonensis TaxID=405782 RepID=UPI000A570C50|nr:zinc metalloprotease HtpX [Streptacidiphilus anmyonensis]
MRSQSASPRSRSRFAPDRQLTVRMATVVFLLGLLYVVFAAVLIALLKSAVLVVVVAGGLLAAQFWFSDRMALFALKAHEVTPEQEPRLHGAVDRLCALADMPKPRLAVADTDLPNAFATGRDADHAVLCVTTGMLRRLDGDELDGVLAHELSHIAHRDVVVITVASFLGVLAGLAVRVGFYSGLVGGRARRDQNTALIVAAVVVVSAAVYALSFMMIRALSRYREFAADRSAAQLTGRPSALASALVKVSGTAARIPTKDLRTAQAFSAFLFAPVPTGHEGEGEGEGRFAQLMSTHPTLQSRLDALGRISHDLGED